jgi:uncharacterized protein
LLGLLAPLAFTDDSTQILAKISRFPAHSLRVAERSGQQGHVSEPEGGTGNFGLRPKQVELNMARMEMAAAEGASISPLEGTAEAYYRLGLLYSAGRDCPLDYVVAHKWFNVALARGHHGAAELRSELASQMTADEIGAALREARSFLTRH